MTKFIFYRVGWADKGNKRFGWLWAWIGPYVIGWGWDRLDTPEEVEERRQITEALIPWQIESIMRDGD